MTDVELLRVQLRKTQDENRALRREVSDLRLILAEKQPQLLRDVVSDGHLISERRTECLRIGR